MNSPHLMQAIVDVVLFFGLCSDDTIDPDDAVRQLENIAYHLQKLSETEQGEFIAYTQSLALSEQAKGASVDRVAFIRNIGKFVGITSEA